MRNNQPVTGREIIMDDGSMIVSETDEKGKIRFINKDFMDISAFHKDELINQPHNVIRHPDMPTEAFEDMWRDLKNGAPWSGYVKNRCKNGDHYWVRANAMPVVENGILKGYISLRSKPDNKVVREVESIYRLFREGKAADLIIKHGQVIGTSLSARLGRYLGSITGKVAAASGIFCVLIMLISGVGSYLNSQTTESLRTVYEDRTICAGQLSDVAHMTDAILYDLGLLASGVTTEDHKKKMYAEIEENKSVIDKIWTEYTGTHLTPEEKVLADRYSEDRKKMMDQIVTPALSLIAKNKNSDAISLLVANDDLYDAAKDTNGKLVSLQLSVAKGEYDASKTRYAIGNWVTLIVVALSLFIAVGVTRFLARKLKERLAYLNSRLSSIAGGNFTTDVKIGNDEMQTILISIQALQAKLAYGEMQKKEATREKIAMQHELADRFEREVSALITDIGTSASQLQSTAQSMAETAEQTSMQSSMVAAASEEATANVQNVSAATEELTSSISEIQRRVSQSTENVTMAVQQAGEANKKVSRLTDAAEKIGAVVEMIHKIAGQTNLLALNATIEAARAGEAGKGFAVVASEVKSLAGQTAKATEEISQQVARIQAETQQSVDAIQHVSSVINDVNATTAAISAAVSEQGSATQEIARNITEAAIGTQEVSSSIARVHQAAQNTGTAAGKVLDAASGLAKNSGSLKAQVQEFLNSVRNA